MQTCEGNENAKPRHLPGSHYRIRVQQQGLHPTQKFQHRHHRNNDAGQRRADGDDADRLFLEGIDPNQFTRYQSPMFTDAQSQIKELESRIQQLRVSQVSELKEMLREAKQTVVALEAELAKLTGHAPPPTGKIIRRTRTSTEDMRAGILKTLAMKPTGMSQKEIADATGLNYQSVGLFMKKNLKDFKFTGALKGKRYFLK